MAFATGRQRYLLRQGYSYKVMKSMDMAGFQEMSVQHPFAYGTQREQDSLLATVLAHKLGV